MQKRRVAGKEREREKERGENDGRKRIAENMEGEGREDDRKKR